MRRPARFWPLYIAWIAVCAVLFFALRGQEDPARPEGVILSIDAGVRARQVLLARDPLVYRDYHALHVARAKNGEGGSVDRWVVLLDRVPHTAMKDAVVVELRASDGVVTSVRRPVTN